MVQSTNPHLQYHAHEGVDKLPSRTRSRKHSRKTVPRIQSTKNGALIMEIGKCIENLRTQKAILKAENAHLTRDIRKLNALRIQQTGLEAEMAQIVEDIHQRHGRIERPYRCAVGKARGVGKTAARVEKQEWADFKVAEGDLEPYVELDEGGEVVLKQEHEGDAERETLFESYSNARSLYESLQAARTRLRQSEMELLDMGDFVGKVRCIALGDVELPCERSVPVPAQEENEGTEPPARVSRRCRNRRNSFPWSTRDGGERCNEWNQTMLSDSCAYGIPSRPKSLR
jgi:hypothetical protein